MDVPPPGPTAPAARLPDAWCACAVFCIALGLVTAGLGDSSLWSRDETRYADIARTMLADGDALTLHWNGRPWLNHPPLFFWLEALAFRILGVSELSARLPAAIFGAAGTALVFWGGAIFLSRRAALAAALALLLNPLFYLESRMAIIDTLFIFFLSLTMLGFWLGWRGDRRGWVLFFSGWGMACLTKGPWGLVYPLAIIIPFAALGGGLRRLRAAPWRWGLPLALTLGGAWYLIGTARHGVTFVHTVLGYYFLGRITTPVEQQGGPFWLYLPVLAAGFLPWSFLLPPALRDLWGRRTRDDARLLLCWLLVPLAGLSVATTKLPSYACLVLPPCALAIGAWLDRMHDRRPLAVPLALAALFSLTVSAAMGHWGSAVAPIPPDALAAAQTGYTLQGIGLFLGAVCARGPGRWPAPIALSAAGTCALLLTLALTFFPALEPMRSLRAISAVLRQAAPRESPTAIYGPGVFGVIFYADHGPIDEIEDPDALRLWIERTPGGIVVLRRDTASRLPEALLARLTPVGGAEHEIVLRVR